MSKFEIPIGLKSLLDELTKEVLSLSRSEERNLYEFCADFLERKLSRRDESYSYSFSPNKLAYYTDSDSGFEMTDVLLPLQNLSEFKKIDDNNEEEKNQGLTYSIENKENSQEDDTTLSFFTLELYFQNTFLGSSKILLPPKSSRKRIELILSPTPLAPNTIAPNTKAPITTNTSYFSSEHFEKIEIQASPLTSDLCQNTFIDTPNKNSISQSHLYSTSVLDDVIARVLLEHVGEEEFKNSSRSLRILDLSKLGDEGQTPLSDELWFPIESEDRFYNSSSTESLVLSDNIYGEDMRQTKERKENERVQEKDEKNQISLNEELPKELQHIIESLVKTTGSYNSLERRLESLETSLTTLLNSFESFQTSRMGFERDLMRIVTSKSESQSDRNFLQRLETLESIVINKSPIDSTPIQSCLSFPLKNDENKSEEYSTKSESYIDIEGSQNSQKLGFIQEGIKEIITSSLEMKSPKKTCPPKRLIRKNHKWESQKFAYQISGTVNTRNEDNQKIKSLEKEASNKVGLEVKEEGNHEPIRKTPCFSPSEKDNTQESNDWQVTISSKHELETLSESPKWITITSKTPPLLRSPSSIVVKGSKKSKEKVFDKRSSSSLDSLREPSNFPVARPPRTLSTHRNESQFSSLPSNHLSESRNSNLSELTHIRESPDGANSLEWKSLTSDWKGKDIFKHFVTSETSIQDKTQGRRQRNTQSNPKPEIRSKSLNKLSHSKEKKKTREKDEENQKRRRSTESPSQMMKQIKESENRVAWIKNYEADIYAASKRRQITEGMKINKSKIVSGEIFIISRGWALDEKRLHKALKYSSVSFSRIQSLGNMSKLLDNISRNVNVIVIHIGSQDLLDVSSSLVSDSLVSVANSMASVILKHILCCSNAFDSTIFLISLPLPQNTFGNESLKHFVKLRSVFNGGLISSLISVSNVVVIANDNLYLPQSCVPNSKYYTDSLHLSSMGYKKLAGNWEESLVRVSKTVNGELILVSSESNSNCSSPSNK